MEASYFPEADTLQSAVREFSAVSQRGSEGQAEAAARLRMALHVVEDAVRDFGGRFILSGAQRWGYLYLRRLVAAASIALQEMGPV